jgi:hypothetical protein
MTCFGKKQPIETPLKHLVTRDCLLIEPLQAAALVKFLGGAAKPIQKNLVAFNETTQVVASILLPSVLAAANSRSIGQG